MDPLPSLSVAPRVRAFQVLQLLRAWRTPQEIAAVFPNRKRGGQLGVGVTAVQEAATNGTHAILAAVLRGARPDDLPEDLWPPAALRVEVNLALRSQTRWQLVKGWLAAPDPAGPVTVPMGVKMSAGEAL